MGDNWSLTLCQSWNRDQFEMHDMQVFPTKLKDLLAMQLMHNIQNRAICNLSQWLFLNVCRVLALYIP